MRSSVHQSVCDLRIDAARRAYLCLQLNQTTQADYTMSFAEMIQETASVYHELYPEEDEIEDDSFQSCGSCVVNSCFRYLVWS